MAESGTALVLACVVAMNSMMAKNEKTIPGNPKIV
eukprot:CAMPEP_0202478384 /NCGR_PEP_ID=MMETSP1360-20130828/94431_1 /ASSEMBLY_ACC=CAM_ASM_000848 /TAXON_ID=515479 /ORGANISM="Licmophora paradoxa, Strain CCMP2313" /LENGTH=34 /DNA_ID= /DNA_START= /DNA_END= /DNA_ORIENTATION=